MAELITIKLPEGFKNCEGPDATHVFVDAAHALPIHPTNPGASLGQCVQYPTGEWISLKDLDVRVTAYLREELPPPPFRAAFETRIVPHTIVEGDNHGHPYERVVSYCVELPRWMRCPEGMMVQVTIEEIREAAER